MKRIPGGPIQDGGQSGLVPRWIETDCPCLRRDVPCCLVCKKASCTSGVFPNKRHTKGKKRPCERKFFFDHKGNELFYHQHQRGFIFWKESESLFFNYLETFHKARIFRKKCALQPKKSCFSPAASRFPEIGDLISSFFLFADFDVFPSSLHLARKWKTSHKKRGKILFPPFFAQFRLGCGGVTTTPKLKAGQRREFISF